MKHFDLEDLIQYEAVNILCEEQVGAGEHRTVFRCRFEDTKVLKVANSTDGIRANIEEMETWNRVHGKMERWFAACPYISRYGTILVQEYIPPLPKGTYQVPVFFDDLKQDNFGLVVKDGKPQVVCRDYGLHSLREVGMSKKLRKWEVK